jgi:hypothetical protein
MGQKLAKQIREAAVELVQFTIHDLADRLCIRSYAEKARLKGGLKGLKKTGEIVSVQPGIFRYKMRQRPFSMTEKMWRAIIIKGRFTWRDLVLLSGASRSHAHKYLRFLEQKGIIRSISTSRKYSEGCYILIEPEKAPLEHPVLESWKNRKERR